MPRKIAPRTRRAPRIAHHARPALCSAPRRLFSVATDTCSRHLLKTLLFLLLSCLEWLLDKERPFPECNAWNTLGTRGKTLVSSLPSHLSRPHSPLVLEIITLIKLLNSEKSLIGGYCLSFIVSYLQKDNIR